MNPSFPKGTKVSYCGEIYEILQSQKHSDMVVLKKRGEDFRNQVYTWLWKLRKIDG